MYVNAYYTFYFSNCELLIILLSKDLPIFFNMPKNLILFVNEINLKLHNCGILLNNFF